MDPAPVPKWAQEKFFEAGEHRELTELEHAMLAVAFDLQPTRAGNRIRSLVASEYLPEQTPKLKRDLLDMHERLVEKFSSMECTSWYNDAKISLLRDLARASEKVAGVTDGIRGTRQILLEEEIPNLRELKVGMLFLDREREKLFKINEIRIGERVEGTVLGSVTVSSVWETSPGRFSNNGVKIALNSPRFRDLVRECEEVTGKRNPGEPMNRLLKRLLGSAQEP
ncbi:MAG: hypothetical protein KDD70_15665 [Bdellovibrionales bacterium]|nr:hypothetical protein [Bdellovibrionales bacterium]